MIVIGPEAPLIVSGTPRAIVWSFSIGGYDSPGGVAKQ